jgi:hypothetical protein
VSSVVVAMEEKGLISKRAHSSRTILFMEGLQCIVKLLHCGYITLDYRIICRIVLTMVLWPVPFIFDMPGNGLMGGDGLTNTIQNAQKCGVSTQIDTFGDGLMGGYGLVWWAVRR